MLDIPPPAGAAPWIPPELRPEPEKPLLLKAFETVISVLSWLLNRLLDLLELIGHIISILADVAWRNFAFSGDFDDLGTWGPPS